jgi:hypothetical protein
MSPADDMSYLKVLGQRCRACFSVDLARRALSLPTEQC